MVVVGLVLAIAQQLIGVNTVIYYAPTILKFTGLSTASAITQALSVGITNVIFTIVAILLLDRVGRRQLLLDGDHRLHRRPDRARRLLRVELDPGLDSPGWPWPA